jgi:hypothetical protein
MVFYAAGIPFSIWFYWICLASLATAATAVAVHVWRLSALRWCGRTGIRMTKNKEDGA